jgi:hypothetical protein
MSINLNGLMSMLKWILAIYEIRPSWKTVCWLSTALNQQATQVKTSSILFTKVCIFSQKSLSFFSQKAILFTKSLPFCSQKVCHFLLKKFVFFVHKKFVIFFSKSLSFLSQKVCHFVLKKVSLFVYAHMYLDSFVTSFTCT